MHSLCEELGEIPQATYFKNQTRWLLLSPCVGSFEEQETILILCIVRSQNHERDCVNNLTM